MDILVGAIGDIVSLALQPECERVFPQQEFARADGQRMIHHLRVLGVGTVEADTHSGDQGLFGGMIVFVQRVGQRPFVVSLPGVGAALEQQVAFAIFHHDESDIALEAVAVAGELAEVDATGPIGGDLPFDGWLPATFAQALGAPVRGGLGSGGEGAECGHMTGTLALVVAHPEDFDPRLGGRFGADMEGDFLPRAHAGA